MIFKSLFAIASKNLIEPDGQPLEQVLQFENSAEQVSRAKAFHQPLLHDLGRVAADRCVRIELRFDRAADLIEVQQRLARAWSTPTERECRFLRPPASLRARSGRPASVRPWRPAEWRRSRRCGGGIRFSSKSSLRSPILIATSAASSPRPSADREQKLQELFLQARHDAVRPFPRSIRAIR